MNKIVIVILLLLYTCSSSIAQKKVDHYMPYLVENETIVMSRQLRDNDTLKYLIEIIDLKSGVKVNSNNGLTYHIGFYIDAYGLYIKDSIIGDYWALFDEHFRLLSSIPNIVIGKIYIR